jgi:outer membrane receptor protein involved in Fe transport
LTGGLRWTDDKKTFLNNSSAGNLLSPGGGTSYGFGYIFTPPGGEVAEFEKLTGRAVADWRPKLDFTDSTMFYASFSRGYKAGGFNPPNIIPEGSYKPESVDAYEVGTKNELLNDTLQLNLTGFYYAYYGYQFTQAAGFGTVTSNVNAHIYGGEFESKWAPITDLLFNAQLGLLNTRIQNGPNSFSIDQYNPTQGIPNFFAVRTLTGMCVVNATNFGALLNAVKSGVYPTSILSGSPLPGLNICAPPYPALFGLFNGIPAQDQGGVPVSIAGNRLPNVPNLTMAIGGQYTRQLGGPWSVTPRADLRLQGGMFTDLFNNHDQYVESYESVNLTLTVRNEDIGLEIEAYAQNLGSKGDIIGARPGAGPITGSERTVYISDPPIYGVSVSKKF